MPPGNADMEVRQRGAISFIGTLTLVVSVLVVALALDVGRVYLERQRLQGAVDAGALAAARVLAAGGNQEQVQDAAQAAAEENGYRGPVEAVTLGHMESDTGVRKFSEGIAADAKVATAVRVRAEKSVPKSMVASGLLPGDAALAAAATARQESVGTLSVGSFAAGVAPLNNSILGKLLGSAVDLKLDAAGYNGLLTTRLQLGDLKTAMGVATMDALLDTRTQLDQLLSDMESAVRSRDAAVADTLKQLADAAGNTEEITLRELIEVSSDDSAVLDASFNVFELVMGAAQLANKGHLISVDLGSGELLTELGLDGLDLAALRLELDVLEAPKFAHGPPGPSGCHATHDCHTVAHTGQVDVKLHVGTRQATLLPGILSASVGLDLSVQAAKAEAWLEAIAAATPSQVDADGKLQHHAQIGVETTAAGIGIGTWDSDGNLTPSQILTNVKLLGVPVPVTATASAGIAVGELDHDLTFVGPFVPTLDLPSESNTQRVGSHIAPSLGSPAIAVNAGGLEIDLGKVTSALSGIVDPMVSKLSSAVLKPLLDALGIQLGGADVSVVYLSPGKPRLMQ